MQKILFLIVLSLCSVQESLSSGWRDHHQTHENNSSRRVRYGRHHDQNSSQSLSQDDPYQDAVIPMNISDAQILGVLYSADYYRLPSQLSHDQGARFFDAVNETSQRCGLYPMHTSDYTYALCMQDESDTLDAEYLAFYQYTKAAYPIAFYKVNQDGYFKIQDSQRHQALSVLLNQTLDDFFRSQNAD